MSRDRLRRGAFRDRHAARRNREDLREDQEQGSHQKEKERLFEPARVAGFWVPEMISIAGGEDVAGDPGLAPAQVSWGELAGLSPEVVIVMVEGYLEDVQAQAMEVWEHIDGLGADRVFAVAAQAGFSDPGPMPLPELPTIPESST